MWFYSDFIIMGCTVAKWLALSPHCLRPRVAGIDSGNPVTPKGIKTALEAEWMMKTFSFIIFYVFVYLFSTLVLIRFYYVKLLIDSALFNFYDVEELYDDDDDDEKVIASAWHVQASCSHNFLSIQFGPS